MTARLAARYQLISSAALLLLLLCLQLPGTLSFRLGVRSSSATAHPSLKDSDFLVVTATDEAKEFLLQADRTQALSTFMVTNHEPAASHYLAAPAREWHAFYPDDQHETKRAFQVQASRNALAAFVAFKALQQSRADSFKWVFLGNADTMFFVGGAQRAVEGLDWNQPLILSDHMWWTEEPFGRVTHPNFQAPRCAPCKHPDPLPRHMPRGCPCTPAVICGHSQPWLHERNQQACGVPRAPPRSYSMHGMAGALLSVGLLRLIDLDTIQTCVQSEYSTGGDALLTVCLWKAGYAITDPAPLYHDKEHSGITLFDPNLSVLGGGPLAKAMKLLLNLFTEMAGSCDQDCKMELDRTVSLAVESGELNDCPAAALALRALITLAYAKHRGTAQKLQLARPEAVAPRDVKLAYLSHSLDLEGRINRTVQALKEFQNLGPTGSRGADGTGEMFTKIRLHGHVAIIRQLFTELIHDGREAQKTHDAQLQQQLEDNKGSKDTPKT